MLHLVIQTVVEGAPYNPWAVPIDLQLRAAFGWILTPPDLNTVSDFEGNRNSMFVVRCFPFCVINSQCFGSDGLVDLDLISDPFRVLTAPISS